MNPKHGCLEDSNMASSCTTASSRRVAINEARVTTILALTVVKSPAPCVTRPHCLRQQWQR